MERCGAPATGAPRPGCELGFLEEVAGPRGLFDELVGDLAVDETLHRRRRRLEVRFRLGTADHQRVEATRFARHDTHGFVAVGDFIGNLFDDYKLLDGNGHLCSLEVNYSISRSIV